MTPSHCEIQDFNDEYLTLGKLGKYLSMYVFGHQNQHNCTLTVSIVREGPIGFSKIISIE